MTRRLASLADFSYRRRGTVVLLWIVSAAVIIALGFAFAGEYEADYNTPGSDSKAASELTENAFDGYSGQEVYVAWKDPKGTNRSAAKRGIEDFFATAEAVPHIEKHQAIRVSEDSTIATTTLPLTIPGWEVPKEDGEALVEAAEENSSDSLQIELGGDPILRAQETSNEEGIAFLGAAIVLLIAF